MYIYVCIKAWTTTDTRNSVNKFQMHEMKKKIQIQKGMYIIILFLWHFEKGKTIGIENKSVLAKAYRFREQVFTTNRPRGTFCDDLSIL